MRTTVVVRVFAVALLVIVSCKASPAPSSMDSGASVETQADASGPDVLSEDSGVPGPDDGVEISPADVDPADFAALDAVDGDGASADLPVLHEDAALDGLDAADGYVVATPTGACDDGVDLPLPGEPCTGEGTSSCTRVGESVGGATTTAGVNFKYCRRPSRLVCVTSAGGALTWQISPCPEATKACGGWVYDWTCRVGGKVSACCPPAAKAQATPGAIYPGSPTYCTSDQKGQRQCANNGNVVECTTYAEAKLQLTGTTPEAFETALGPCMSKDPLCVAFYPLDVCKVQNWKVCANYDPKKIDSGSIGNWCTDNYLGVGAKCLNTCDDLKNYCKTCTPWPGK